jgi:hypothetical protein
VAEDTSLTSGALEVVLIEKVGLLMRPDIMARILAKSPLARAMKSFPSQGIMANSPAARARASRCRSTARSGATCRCRSASNRRLST